MAAGDLAHHRDIVILDGLQAVTREQLQQQVYGDEHLLVCGTCGIRDRLPDPAAALLERCQHCEGTLLD